MKITLINYILFSFALKILFISVSGITTNGNSIQQQLASSKNKKQNVFYKESDLQSVFKDITCQNCISCMQKTIRAHKIRPTVFNYDDQNQNIGIENRYKIHYRDKRNTQSILDASEEKKTKSKNEKVRVTVTKYNVDGIVYALKIKEKMNTSLTGEKINNDPNTCQVYSVKKSYPCDTPNTNFITSAFIKKAKKRIKKSKISHDGNITPHFINYQYASSQVGENFVPSIEDVY